jgi:hypothetical protein
MAMANGGIAMNNDIPNKPIPPSIVAAVNKGYPMRVAQSMGKKPVSTVRVK